MYHLNTTLPNKITVQTQDGIGLRINTMDKETGQTNGDGNGLLSQCFYSKGVAVTIVELPPSLGT